jgi:WS/DGAT/MGAT family acyltransferase
MRQLTSLDAQFLALENDRQVGHVASLALFDPATAPGGELTRASLERLIRARLPALPPLRWRVREVPLGLDYPYWVDDPDFDLDYHVHELALPPPGSEAQLAAQAARIFSRPLDRARPLWELYVIHGLTAGLVAVLTKIRHAVIDGMSGAEVMGLLLDMTPEERVVSAPPPPPAEEPGELEMLGRGALGVARYPLRLARSLPTAALHAAEAPAVFSPVPGATTVSRLAARAAGLLGSEVIEHPELKAPRTSLSGRVSPHRRFAFGRLPLDAVKAVKNAFGVTVNDVVVCLCAGAVRRWLIAHHELPAEPLVAQIPVSVRSRAQRGTYGNRILLMRAPLFTSEPDPERRLELTHAALLEMKSRHRALPAELLQDANHFIPPAVFARAAQLSFRVASGRAGRPHWNLVVSNVPGPQFCSTWPVRAWWRTIPCP